jgi:ParB-like chromosome segregation protein Spo0J
MELSVKTLSIDYQAVSALKPRATNPRTHSKKQIVPIANAIRRFGFTNPVLVDDANGIVAGHGRVEAAKIVGLDQVPTVRLSAMSEAEIRAYVIADNRLAENAGWDRALLGIELQYLTVDRSAEVPPAGKTAGRIISSLAGESLPPQRPNVRVG